MSTCKRCGKPFEPEPLDIPTWPMTTCCDTCRMRNLFDGLDLPTPPDLLDIHTKWPTLSQDEFQTKLSLSRASDGL